MNRRDFLGRLLAGGVCAAMSGCIGPFGRSRKKFSLNASSIRGYGLDLRAQVEAAIAGGFTGFEPWLKDVHAAKAAGTLKDAVAAARDGGLEFVNAIAFGRWVDPDPAIRAEGLEETKRDMDVLAEMGCPLIAACMFGVHKPGSPHVENKAISERFEAVCELGRQTGVKPLLEYWGHSVNMNTAEATLDVLAMVKPEDAAILADVYHTYRGGGSFETYRRFGGNLLPVLHVNDYPGMPPREQLVAADRVWPGAGLAPWRKIFEYLDEAGADPWLSIEVFNPNYWKTTPVQTSKEGYEWLDRTYALRPR